ncbi:hypothetical protein CCUS01_16850 [Colletotrichum cuscutae]|uniref:Uncharacterized protein n=1 Tax=Colletotrichum cuscutae TaxID=1209917 RepID=A0AAI9VDY5_9PEZI|nr:hypothetical protein CCUS01_16850 [Colletotrichum cuscutae]
MVAMARRTGSTEPHHTQSHTRLGSRAMEICHPQGFRMEPHFTAPTGVENLELGQREGNEHPQLRPRIGIYLARRQDAFAISRRRR